MPVTDRALTPALALKSGPAAWRLSACTRRACLRSLRKCFRALAMQHGQGRGHARLHAARGRHRDRARRILYRPAGPGIQDVAVAHAVLQQKAPRIAAGGERAVSAVPACPAISPCRSTDSMATCQGLPSARGPVDGQVAAEIDQRRRIGNRAHRRPARGRRHIPWRARRDRSPCRRAGSGRDCARSPSSIRPAAAGPAPSRASGTLSEPSNRQARRSTPEVMSNRPSLN